ncbi:biopolymer transporter Tol [Herbiconiux sp. SALV-R1]|uniref:biopolymer transporter Tol n=1 Tax=unclassified Herbiconiux TaxID=2618217 RepID=UPI00352CD518
MDESTDAKTTNTPDARADTAEAAEVPLGETDAERWLVIDGRRWRRTDPELPAELIEALKSELGRGRAGVRAARRADDDTRLSAARRRVDLAKRGLGERGPAWWDLSPIDRLSRAEAALAQLRASSGGGSGGSDTTRGHGTRGGH